MEAWGGIARPGGLGGIAQIIPAAQAPSTKGVSAAEPGASLPRSVSSAKGGQGSLASAPCHHIAGTPILPSVERVACPSAPPCPRRAVWSPLGLVKGLWPGSRRQLFNNFRVGSAGRGAAVSDGARKHLDPIAGSVCRNGGWGRGPLLLLRATWEACAMDWVSTAGPAPRFPPGQHPLGCFGGPAALSPCAPLLSPCTGALPLSQARPVYMPPPGTAAPQAAGRRGAEPPAFPAWVRSTLTRARRRSRGGGAWLQRPT